jgi:hypothetical protein
MGGSSFKKDRDWNEAASVEAGAASLSTIRTTGSSQRREWAIVDEKAVSQIAETIDGLAVVDGDRLLAEIAAGHDESLEATFGKEDDGAAWGRNTPR